MADDYRSQVDRPRRQPDGSIDIPLERAIRATVTLGVYIHGGRRRETQISRASVDLARTAVND